MLVYHSQWQPIEHNDIILISKNYYIVAYDMRICTFILYPLSWHQIEKQHLGILNEFDWEYIGPIEDIDMWSDFGKFIDRMPWWIQLYMDTITTNLSI